MRVPIALVPFALVSLWSLPQESQAQSCLDDPTALGNVTLLADSCQDGPGPLPNTRCQSVLVECDSLSPIVCSLRITEPDSGVALRGTVVFGTGGSGMEFYGAQADGQALFTELAALGFRIVDRKWASPGWFSGGALTRWGSCRYATLITWVHDTIHTDGAFCASGNSGGSAEIGFALTSWGRGAILDVAVPTSGPPLGRLDYACPQPPPAEWAAICDTIVPAGVLECGEASCSISPTNPVCTQCGATPTAAELRNQSVVNEEAALDYPTTLVYFLFGALDCGASIPMGLTWANAMTSARIVEYVPGTPHRLWSTPEGRAAIVRALLAGTGATGVDGAAAGTAPRALLEAWPNPSRGGVRFALDLPRASDVALAVYDLSGRRVRRILAERMGAGRAVLAWDGRDDRGEPLAAGVYIARAAWDGGSSEARVTLLR